MSQDTLPDLSQITALIRARRSVKPPDYEFERPVAAELWRGLLENAIWAPTHGLTEPWRFHVFEGAARRRLADALQQAYRESTPEAEFRADKFDKLAANPRLAPLVIAIVLERRSAKVPEIEEIEAVACAVQNLLLSATAAGLASFWSSPPVLDAPHFQSWLGLAETDRCLGLIYLGWPRAGLPLPRVGRRPLEEKLVHHHD
jgi:nitroreductase